MLIEDIFGKTITNIYATFGIDQGWLDTADCFIELDNKLIIGFPYGFDKNVWVREIDKESVSLFKNLEDYPVYHVNKERKSIEEIAKSYQKRKNNILYKIRNALFGKELEIKEYQPYLIEYKENKVKYIQNSKIVDFLWYDDDSIKGLFLLENGYIISETQMSPSGTGMAGLNYYESLDELSASKGDDFKSLKGLTKSSS